MSGFHPVASGSIPGIGCPFCLESLFSSVAERFTRNEQVPNSILGRGCIHAFI
jgi:hypothetical protein